MKHDYNGIKSENFKKYYEAQFPYANFSFILILCSFVLLLLGMVAMGIVFVLEIV